MIAWMTAGSLCLLAAGLCLSIPKSRVQADADLAVPSRTRSELLGRV